MQIKPGLWAYPWVLKNEVSNCCRFKARLADSALMVASYQQLWNVAQKGQLVKAYSDLSLEGPVQL